MKQLYGNITASLLLPMLLAAFALAAPVREAAHSVLDQGETWELPLQPGEYAYCISYVEGDMFITVNTLLLDPEGGVLSETSHTLVRGERMSVRKAFQAVGDADGPPHRIRFVCDSGRVEISVESAAEDAAQ